MAADVPDKGSPHDRARIVRRYLSALDARKPGRSSARTAEAVAHRMHQVDTLLMSADPLQRLHLTQERIDLHAEHLRLNTAHGDFEQLEKAFVRVARAWGDRHDITYSAWRQVGVDNEVLARAGITPAPKPPRPQSNGAPAATPAKGATESSDGKDVDAALPKTERASGDGVTKPAPRAKKTTTSKKAPAAKKTAAATKAETTATGDGAAPAGAAASVEAADPEQTSSPEQQQLPAEAHLLS
jgi:hypothetical protein